MQDTCIQSEPVTTPLTPPIQYGDNQYISLVRFSYTSTQQCSLGGRCTSTAGWYSLGGRCTSTAGWYSLGGRCTSTHDGIHTQ